MNIQVISDLHQEFGYKEPSFDEADVAVIAGDVNLGVKGIHWLKERFPKMPVIYVLGNHEYYKGSYPRTLKKILALAEDTHIHVLENRAVDVGGVRFHGATLWTDFSLYGDSKTYGVICQMKMNDYKYIRRDPSYARLRSVDTYQIHKESVRWLEESLGNATAATNVVVTHHAPSIKSLPPQEHGNPVSSAYASNLEELIVRHAPRYWVHGHIHTPTRYFIGKTEVICNPHGYIDERYNGYEEELVISF